MTNPGKSSIPEFKVVLVGNSSVGKTSIIMRRHHNTFSDDRQTTIGAGYVQEEIQTKYGNAKINIWDTAGQERYRCLVPMYARGSNVALLVFDITYSETFDSLDDWVEKIRTDVSENCPIVVAGNKLDLGCPPDLREKYDSWAQDNSITLIYVSAKTGESIDILFQEIINYLPKAPFLVNQPVTVEQNESKGCC